MDTLTKQDLATAIAELSKSFLNNYFRALNEARIAINDVSNLSIAKQGSEWAFKYFSQESAL